MFRQVTKKDAGEILIGHQDIHRVLKEMVKKDQEINGDMDFTKTMIAMMLKHMDSCLKSRAVWIFVQILENAKTAPLVKSELKNAMKDHKDLIEDDKNKGIKMLMEKLK